jgi:hypothetical protein
MNLVAETWSAPNALKIRRVWASHRDVILRVANLGLAVYALLKLGDEFRRLLFEPSDSGAKDLHNFYLQTPAWFDGHRAFLEFNLSPYPPASFAIMLPFVSWFDWTGTRWLWAIVSLFALAWLVFLVVQSSGARTQIETALAALMLVSMNATGVTIGNGQLILLVLPTLLTGLLLLRDANRFLHDFLASALISFSLVKPSISAPFLLLVLLPNRLRPVLLVAGMYSLLTFFALIPQFPNLDYLIPDILFRSSAAVITAEVTPI